MSHTIPPSQRFMNVALDPKIFDDQYCMAICEGFCRDDGMLQRIQTLKEDNKDLEDCLKTSQTIAAELQCHVMIAERSLLEKEEKERAWDEERAKLIREREVLVEDFNHYKAAALVSGSDVETLYVELVIIQEDNQKLPAEHHWLLS
ncbi:hypothetical protein HanPI659440_Chr10g0379331 [Helianthus annuus]|nr:hypothetical protein HanOQP8_Chr10g0365751 [Helianthus annuus]KAJ0743731.1 hypothetical protein HanPI659440_Chr10g0379331 [Helianthus annuus]KAJ0883760.1 hypothetical protein HanPSC8_Chr10g0425411 [Helianthus annuus]